MVETFELLPTQRINDMKWRGEKNLGNKNIFLYFYFLPLPFLSIVMISPSIWKSLSSSFWSNHSSFCSNPYSPTSSPSFPFFVLDPFKLVLFMTVPVSEVLTRSQLSIRHEERVIWQDSSSLYSSCFIQGLLTLPISTHSSCNIQCVIWIGKRNENHANKSQDSSCNSLSQAYGHCVHLNLDHIQKPLPHKSGLICFHVLSPRLKLYPFCFNLFLFLGRALSVYSENNVGAIILFLSPQKTDDCSRMCLCL